MVIYIDDMVFGGHNAPHPSEIPLQTKLDFPLIVGQGPTFEMVKSYRRLVGFGVMLIATSSPDNRVTLDQDGEPIINYVLSEPDKVRFRRGVAEAVRIMFLAGAKQVFLPTTEDILGDGVSPVVLTDLK